MNLAQRMEMHGVPGRVQVTRARRGLFDGAFAFEPRGTITVKRERAVEAFLVVPPSDPGS